MTPSILYHCASHLKRLGERGLEVESLKLYQSMVASKVLPGTGRLDYGDSSFSLDDRGNAAICLTELLGVASAEVLWRSLIVPDGFSRHRYAGHAARALAQIAAERRGEDPGSQGSP